MTAQITRWWLIAGALIGGILHGPVFADPLATESSPFSSAAAVSGETLDAYRGGAEVINVKNSNQLDGVVSDNQAYNLNTGSNLVTDGSFAGANGFATVVQNTGNNVLIQNSTIVNVQLK